MVACCWRENRGQSGKRADEAQICTGDSQLSRGVTYTASKKPKDADLSENLQKGLLKQDKNERPTVYSLPLSQRRWELSRSSGCRNGCFLSNSFPNCVPR